MNSTGKNYLAAGLVATLTVAIPTSRAAEKTAGPGTSIPSTTAPLQLTVDVPVHWRPFLSDDLAEAFASRAADILRRAGFAGKVNFLDRAPAQPGLPLLALQLIAWRVGVTDTAECTFTASLTVDGREHDLGIFENTDLVWSRSQGRWGLAEAMGDAADGALRDLSRRLAQSGLVAGLEPAKKK